MPYVLQPLVGGELGQDVEFDHSTHPPGLDRVQYVLDYPTSEDLMESFPAYIVSETLADQLVAAGLRGFTLAEAADVWLDDALQLCVSDRMMRVLEGADLSRAEIEPL